MLLAKVDAVIREGLVRYLDGEILRISCSSYPNDPIGGFESSFLGDKGRTFQIRVGNGKLIESNSGLFEASLYLNCHASIDELSDVFHHVFYSVSPIEENPMRNTRIMNTEFISTAKKIIERLVIILIEWRES